MNTFARALLLYFGSLTLICRAEPPRKLDAIALRAVRAAAFDSFIRNFNENVKTGPDLERAFDFKRKPRDLRQIRQVTADLGRAPKLSRNGTTIHLDFGDEAQIDIAWTDFGQSQVRIGKVTWVYDASAAPAYQIQQLEQRTKRAEGERSALSRLLVPEAHALLGRAAAACAKVNCLTWAGLITATSVIQGVAGDVKTAAFQFNCYLIYNYTTMNPASSIGWCRDWKKDDDLLKKADRADSVGNTDELKKMSLWKFKREDCPTSIDKKGQEYGTSTTELVKNKNSDWEANDWLYFTAKTVEGEVTEASVFKNRADALLPNPRDVALVRFEFSKDLLSPVSVHFRTVHPTPTALSLISPSSTISVKSSEKNPDVKQPGLAAQTTRMIYMVQLGKNWVESCITDSVISTTNSSGDVRTGK